MSRAKEDHHQFRPLLLEIEEEPQNPLGRLIFWIVILALLFFSLWLSLGRVDVVVTARGRVVPVGEAKTIQPTSTGVVNNIRVKPGQLVAAGEVLMEIDPADTASELVSMRADLKQTELDILRSETLLTDRPFTPSTGQYDAELPQVQHRLYQSGRDQLRRQIQVKREELAQIAQQRAGEQIAYEQAAYRLDTSRQRLERLEPVRELVSQDDLDQARTDVATHNNQLATAQHKFKKLASAKGQMLRQIGVIEEENRHRLLTDLAQKRKGYLYLQAKIERTEFVNNTRQQIRSPVRGHISQLLENTIGGVVTPAEKLAVVVPADSQQLIRTRVLNKDVAISPPAWRWPSRSTPLSSKNTGCCEAGCCRWRKTALRMNSRGWSTRPTSSRWRRPCESTGRRCPRPPACQCRRRSRWASGGSLSSSSTH